MCPYRLILGFLIGFSAASTIFFLTTFKNGAIFWKESPPFCEILTTKKPAKSFKTSTETEPPKPTTIKAPNPKPSWKFAAISNSRSVTPKSFLIYSAFLDRRVDQLRILALKRCDNNETRLFAHLKTESGDVKTLNLTISAILSGGRCVTNWAPNCSWGNYFAESALSQYSKIQEIFLDTSPTFSKKDSIKIDKERIHDIPATAKNAPKKIVAFVNALYLFTDVFALIRFVEYHQLLGVRKFYIPIQSVSSDVKKVLDMYQAEGLVETIPWPTFPASKNEDPNLGIYRIAPYIGANDCLLRNVGFAKYLLHLDTDEFLFFNQSLVKGPLNKSLGEFLDVLDQRFANESAFQFKRTFVLENSSFPETLPSANIKFNISQWQIGKNWSPRMKLVLIPDRILTSTIHYVWNPIPGFKAALEKDEEGIPLSIGTALHPRSFLKEMPTTTGLVDSARDWLVKVGGLMTKNFQQRAKRHIPSEILSSRAAAATAVFNCVDRSKWGKEKGCKIVQDCASQLIKNETDWIWLKDAPGKSAFYVV